MPTFDVIGIGCVCWDFVTSVTHYPMLEEKAGMEGLLQQGGGPTSTGLVAVARLGGRASIWGAIGDDDFGTKCLAEFATEGVDTAHLQIVPGCTSQFAFCVAEEGTGRRAIFWKPGNMGKLDPDSLDRAAVTDCKCLLIAAHHVKASIRAAGWAREAGIPVVLDLERPGPDDDALLAVTDHPILPAEYMLRRFEADDPLEAAAAFHRQLGRMLIVTLGPEGSVVFDNGESYHQPAFPVEKVVDTTGAGDVFHGAYAYGLTLGHDVRRNLRFASAVSALKCRALGGRTGIPRMAEVEALLAGGR
jgi:sulfofructose kinase